MQTLGNKGRTQYDAYETLLSSVQIKIAMGLLGGQFPCIQFYLQWNQSVSTTLICFKMFL